MSLGSLLSSLRVFESQSAHRDAARRNDQAPPPRAQLPPPPPAMLHEDLVGFRPLGNASGFRPLACGTERIALATLLSWHSGTSHSTVLSGDAMSTARQQRDKLNMLVDLVLALARSVRRFERAPCVRDFNVLVRNAEAFGGRLEWLRSEGLLLRPLDAPVHAGVPSADKLHVWRLLEYDRVLYLDADIMVIRPLDAAALLADVAGATGRAGASGADGRTARPTRGEPPPVVFAHHPYDHVQQRCGIPLEERSVGAMFLARPGLEEFRGLRRSLKTFNAFHLQHYSEQSALACYFKGVSRTLPCSTLYDVTLIRRRRNEAAGLEKLRLCLRLWKATMERAWGDDAGNQTHFFLPYARSSPLADCS